MLDTMLVQRLRTVVEKRATKLARMQEELDDATYIHGYIAGMEDTMNDILIELDSHVGITRKGD